MSDIDTAPAPHGDLALQTVAMPKDTNANGDIFGGWLWLNYACYKSIQHYLHCLSTFNIVLIINLDQSNEK